MLSRIKFEFDPLVEEILDQFPESEWVSKTSTWLDPAIGGGQFVRAIEARLARYGHSKKNIAKRVFGFEESDLHIRYAINKYKLVGNYTRMKYQDFLEADLGMKFDNVVGNPPYNSAKESVGGTGGNSRLYLHFREKALTCLHPDGHLAYISPKNIVKKLIKDGNEVILINLMTSNDYWKYNTLFFIERNTIKLNEPIITGGICAKIFNAEGWDYKEFNRTEDRIGTGDIEAVISVPKERNNFTTQYAKVRIALPMAPRFGFSLLESKKSHIITSHPFCASMAGCVTFKSLSDANAYKKMLDNNLGLKYFFRAMKLKGYAKDISRFTKKIDLSQIKTGFEYPVEWNLTQEEIDYIESTVK
jgi:hypothetical protein